MHAASERAKDDDGQKTSMNISQMLFDSQQTVLDKWVRGAYFYHIL